MNDKVEWEVVDGEERRDRESFQEGFRPPPPPPRPHDLLKRALGPWWRWKLAAVFVLGGLALVFVAAVAGILVVTGIAFALLALVVMKVRAWLRGGSSGSGGTGGTNGSLPDHYR